MTLAAKAALCVCPTVILGTAAVTLPKARNAVHKATASRSAANGSGKARRHKRQSSQYASLSMPCPPAFAGLAPPIAGVSPIDWDVGSAGNNAAQFGSAVLGGNRGGVYGGGVSVAPGIAAGGGGSGGGGGGGTSAPSTNGTIITPTLPVARAVPEPGTWLLMVGGFSVVGGALRSRRRRGSSAGPMRVGVFPWRVRAGATLTLAAPDAASVAAVASNSATLAKLALCVCPPAMIVGSVATLPVARQAVHAATAPAYKAVNPAVAFRAMPLAPCVPVVESAQSLDSAAVPFRSVLKLGGSTSSI